VDSAAAIGISHCCYDFLLFMVCRTFNDEKSEVIDFQIIWSSSPDSLKYNSYFSLPELIEFPTEVPGQNAYAYFYPPSNHFYQASQEEKPPLLLKSHGTRIIATQILSYSNLPCQLCILWWEIRATNVFV